MKPYNRELNIDITRSTVWARGGRGGGLLPYKGLMGMCGQPGYVFRDFCLKHGINFIIFCLNQGIYFINFCLRESSFNMIRGGG